MIIRLMMQEKVFSPPQKPEEPLLAQLPPEEG